MGRSRNLKGESSCVKRIGRTRRHALSDLPNYRQAKSPGARIAGREPFMNHSSCRREDRELPLDAHVPDEDPLTGLRAPHGTNVVLGCQGVRARLERCKRYGARSVVLHSQGDDLHGVSALLRHELVPKAQRNAREPVVDHRVAGIVLVRICADAVASHGYLRERRWCPSRLWPSARQGFSGFSGKTQAGTPAVKDSLTAQDIKKPRAALLAAPCGQYKTINTC
nr:MAG TPA: hypothetical protein [Caudoviricetes sp.]